MHKNKLLGISVLALMLSQSVFADVELSKYAKVFQGRDGLVVTVAPLMPKDSNQAIIEVKGIESELDGLKLLYKVVDEGNKREAYQMTYDGRISNRMRTNVGYWGNGTEVYLPDVQGTFEVMFDEKATKELNLVKFKEEYLNQEKNKVQEKLAVFKRDKHLKSNEEAIGKLAKEASEACGTTIQANIEWKSISEDNLKELSISSFCGSPLESMADLCKKSPENKKVLSQKISKLSCSMGDKVHLGITDKTLNWVTNKDTPNQGDFTKYVLMNEL